MTIDPGAPWHPVALAIGPLGTQLPNLSVLLPQLVLIDKTLEKD